MYRKYFVFILFWTCIYMYQIAPSFAKELKSESIESAIDSPQTSDKHLNIVSYLGSSTLVGNFGIELQYGKYGYDIGILKSIDVVAIENILCAGLVPIHLCR